MPAQKLNESVILAAIDGFELQRSRIDHQISELRAMLHGGNTHSAIGGTALEPKRKISAAARRRMALGQKARWAKLKGASESPAPAATPEPTKAKRKLSDEGRAAIVKALKKRWAAKKKAA